MSYFPVILDGLIKLLFLVIHFSEHLPFQLYFFLVYSNKLLITDTLLVKFFSRDDFSFPEEIVLAVFAVTPSSLFLWSFLSASSSCSRSSSLPSDLASSFCLSSLFVELVSSVVWEELVDALLLALSILPLLYFGRYSLSSKNRFNRWKLFVCFGWKSSRKFRKFHISLW